MTEYIPVIRRRRCKRRHRRRIYMYVHIYTYIIYNTKTVIVKIHFIRDSYTRFCNNKFSIQIPSNLSLRFSLLYFTLGFTTIFLLLLLHIKRFSVHKIYNAFCITFCIQMLLSLDAMAWSYRKLSHLISYIKFLNFFMPRHA